MTRASTRLPLFAFERGAGIDGIGQAESPSLVIDAAIRTHGGLEDLLRGRRSGSGGATLAKDVRRHWSLGTATGGGVTIAAMGAVETALWDIAWQNPETRRLRADLALVRYLQGTGGN